ncbi:hypothetical protein CCR94_08035 [Rhodoblastus sphagnicola]|uniref:Uncharacterized protein n=1 Tax=Rhodoblastus sphagnicola TaxID=333368 RepID=A0A2S6NAY5_9HYPH|nr:hypothetical protein [Rhodoblastus sphagnicola]MBB4199026.1 hypothetical protein [Rhodoblastus sphagnicola]PPQ31775.1 hypothetical protein CCR94_08035 [Rhodoblastus sphagnicola]
MQWNNGNGTISPGVVIEDGSGNKLGASSNPMNVQGAISSANPSTVFAFRQTATLSAAALPSQVVVNGVVCTALSANTGTIYVGGVGVTTSTGYPLVAGQSISYAATNASAIYMIGTNTTDVLACTGN